MGKILFLSKSESSASTRYRAMQYKAEFEADGNVVHHLPMSGSALSYLNAWKAAGKADVVVVLRKTIPKVFLRLLRRQAKRLVFDFDDAIFCNTDGSPSATRMSRFRDMAVAADAIAAGNSFLQVTASQFNQNCHVVPTSVCFEKYIQTQVTKPTESFDLVWIGSSSTRKYLEEIIPALLEASKRINGLRLKIVADFDLSVPGLVTVPIQWSAETEAAELASAHVGIAPMVDNDWTRGKCALKVLQYMAAGLPVVSSSAGVNKEIVKPGVNGLLALSHAEWVDALVALSALERRGGLIEYGRNGRQLVSEQFSLKRVYEKFRYVVQNA